MTAIAQIRATTEVLRLRRHIIAKEEELVKTTADGPADRGAIRRELADLLRQQADLLAGSPLARMCTMLPSPARLRHDADRLEEITDWDDEDDEAS